MVLKNQSGQAAFEYVLVLAVLVGAFLFVARSVTEIGASEKILTPVREDYRRAYQYGHPKAKGFDEDEGPYLHPRVVDQQNNFRIFINRGK